MSAATVERSTIRIPRYEVSFDFVDGAARTVDAPQNPRGNARRLRACGH
jgi:hypothetical protein